MIEKRLMVRVGVLWILEKQSGEWEGLVIGMVIFSGRFQGPREVISMNL